MSKALATKNVAAVLVVLALVIGAFAFATPARAQTVADLQAQIQLLLAQIAGLQGGSAPVGACFTFTQNLTVGSTGAEVMELQKFLNMKGYTVAATGAGSPGNETSYFGSLSQAAVAKFQAANGISPTAGYFGPITRSAVNSMCVPGPVVPGPVTPGVPGGSPISPLQGGAGSLSDADYISGLNNEEVGEGSEDVEVAGLKLEADDGSDIELTAVNLNFSPGTGVGSNDFGKKYADEVSIWLDGRELARVDARDFKDNQNFDRTVSLMTGGIIRAGDTGDLVVAVSAINNIDSADAGDTWNLEFESVRFRDAQGASVTDSVTGDINDGTGRNFTFDTFATANSVELKATSCDDTPEGVVNVHSSNDTDGVELLCFMLEAKGGDIHLEDLPINFATSSGGTANTLAHIANTVYVSIGGEQWSENVTSSTAVQGASGATVTFDDFDFDLDKGDKVEVIISGDINDTDGNFADGDALTVSFTADNRGVLVAEDESGEDLAAGDKTGTGTGEALAFFDVGIMVTFVSASETVTAGADGTANDDTVTLKLVFDVQAFDGTVYVSNVGAATTVADGAVTAIDVDDGGIVYRYEIGGTATVSGLSHTVSKTNLTGTVDSQAASGADGGEYTFEDGEKARLTLSVTRVNVSTLPTGGAYHELQLVAIGFSSTNEDDTMSVYEFDLDNFDTTPIFAN